MDRICPNCGGQLEIDNAKGTVKCPYCRATFDYSLYSSESDAVRLERMRKTHEKEQAEVQLKREEEDRRRNEENEELRSFKKGAMSKVLIVLIIWCVLEMAEGFNDHRTPAAICAIVQIIIFIVAYLIGMHVIKANRGVRTVLTIIGSIMIFIYLWLYGVWRF